jgi:DNA-binding NtrC family response regulator
MLKPMKRILVIDESEVVRETLALILGREFVVVKRPHERGSLSFSDADSEVDLLILGLSPTIGVESSALLRFAARVPFAVLFLVDSKSVARAIQDRDKIGCLAKPFNPFELKEKVGRLLSRRKVQTKKLGTAPENRQPQSRYLEFPYLGRAAASLVHRFVATRLPLLISGEIGCGQEQVARAVHGRETIPAPCVSLNAGEIGTDYLAQKSFEISCNGRFHEGMLTLLVENLEKVLPSGQSALLNFLEEDRMGDWRLLTTARADLLEKVYQGEFLEALYYKLATLTLKLPPLRDRKEDIPALASWFGSVYAKAVGLGEVTFSADASERLVNYLWFGNLHEMETVVARTLVIRRKRLIEAADLIFDFSEERELDLPEFEEFVPSEASPKKELKLVTAHPAVPNRPSAESRSENGHTSSVDLHALIHELAHELKNPMVTIKTFAQLLSDRYQDEDFRTRFQDVVGDDIERMDDLLEIMIEFADFSQPRASKVPLEEKLRTALKEISEECDKRQARFHWKGNGYNREIRTDEAQLQYILRNVLLAILSQAKMNSEIEIDVEKQGCVAISYLREGARVASIGHYFNTSSPTAEESAVPLRILLAKQLVERNGGRMAMDHSNSERDTLRMEFPIV